MITTILPLPFLHLQPVMYLYAPHTSPRLAYIAHWLGLQLFKKPLVIVTDKDLLKDGWILNYSHEPLPMESFWIKPHSLLFETGIEEQDINVKSNNKLPYFFETQGDFHFDVLAASFYLIQRYEEYLPHTKDTYGRYAHEHSLAFKNQFLHVPLVDVWLEDFKKACLQKLPATSYFQQDGFRFLPTYDIDVAYSYRGKGQLRSLLRGLRTMGRDPWVKIRKDIANGKQKDPFDIYEDLDSLHATYKLQPIYFFLVAQKQKGYDRNIDPATAEMQELIALTAKKNLVGVHPSWQSGDHETILQQEIQTIATILDQTIKKSRQHYIRMQLPVTFQRLVRLGIQEDYSMGYGSINGFRASTCKPYTWYDLTTEQHTMLTIFPYCYMEANSMFEQKFSPAEALKEFTTYYKATKEVGGMLITIFHNHLLGYDERGRKWMDMYKAALEVCKS